MKDNKLGIPSLLHVMAILGHKDIKNVMLYVQLAGTGGNAAFICEVAKNLQEATRLIKGEFGIRMRHGDGRLRTLSERKINLEIN